MKPTTRFLVLILSIICISACSEDQSPMSTTNEFSQSVEYSKFDLGNDVSAKLSETVLSILPGEIVESSVAGAICNVDGKISAALQFEEGTVCAYRVDVLSNTYQVIFYMADGQVFEHGEKRRYDISDSCQELELQLLYCQNGGGDCSGILAMFLNCS